MMKSLHSHKHQYQLPLSQYLLLHRLRNPSPHRLTNPLRPLFRPLPRQPHRNPRRILMRLLNCFRHTLNYSNR